MVSNANHTRRRKPVNQGVRADIAEPNKIGASTPYDFDARNLTAYGGLLPVATMLEKLGFQQLIEETLTVKRQTRSMPMFRFILGMVLAFLRARGEKTPGGQVPLSVPELRHLLIHLLWRGWHSVEHLLHWFQWRRYHQFHALRCHYRKRGSPLPIFYLQL